MKRIMKVAIAAVVAASSFAAQAEKLYWTASDIGSSGSSQLTGTGQYSAYLFCTGVFPEYAGLYKGSTITTLSDVIGWLSSSNAKDTDISTYSKVGVSGEAAAGPWTNNGYSDGKASFTDEYIGWIGTDTTTGNSKVDLFAVVFDAATWNDAQNYMVLTDTDGNPMSKTLTTAYNSSSTTYFDFGSQANNSWHAIGTVPEPTSGLLLLVGLSALALKRKRA